MNVLVLIPSRSRLEYDFFGSARRAALSQRRTAALGDPQATRQALRQIAFELTACELGRPDVLAIRVASGGEDFTEAARVDGPLLDRLAGQIPQAPLHLPVAISLARAAGEIFPDAAVVMVFETAFFSQLPHRERSYALGGQSAGRISRGGYHGLYHQAAITLAASQPALRARRVLSICLDPQPELAAVMGNLPVMVTTGASPLDGIPGDTTCGQLDASIPLLLAEKLRWGPEQINKVLTQESGLAALAGKGATLERVFSSPGDRWAFAREVILYRLTLACGAGIAAMGGLDMLVFSGRYVGAAHKLAPMLQKRLSLLRSDGRAHAAGRTSISPAGAMPAVSWKTVTDSLPRIIADQALAAAVAAA